MAIDQSTSSAPCATQSYVPPLFPSPAQPPAAATSAPSDRLTSHPDRPSAKEFRPRQLKITDLPQTHESVPFLRLSGKWLAEAGFTTGSHVRVCVSSERLVIEPKVPECKSDSQIRGERRAALRQIADRNLETAAAVYPSIGSVEMVCDDPCNSRPTAEATRAGAAARLQHSDIPASCSTREVRRIGQTRGTWPQRIGAAIAPAFGDVLFMENSRLNVSAVAIAQRAQVSESRYRAFDRGNAQPNLSTFIAIAWALGQDPRELFDKLLLQVGLQPGMRPVISPGIG